MKNAVCYLIALLGAAQLISACTIRGPVIKVLRIKSFVAEEVEMTCSGIGSDAGTVSSVRVAANGDAKIKKADRNHGLPIQSLFMGCDAVASDRYLVCVNTEARRSLRLPGAQTVNEMPFTYEIRELDDHCSSGFIALANLRQAERAEVPSDMSGSWETQCITQPSGNGSVAMTLEIGEESYKLEQTQYADQDCQEAQEVVNVDGSLSVWPSPANRMQQADGKASSDPQLLYQQIFRIDFRVQYAEATDELQSDEEASESDTAGEDDRSAATEIGGATLIVPGDISKNTVDVIYAFYPNLAFSSEGSSDEETLTLTMHNYEHNIATEVAFKRP